MQCVDLPAHRISYLNAPLQYECSLVICLRLVCLTAKAVSMDSAKIEFDPVTYLANAGPGRRLAHHKAKEAIFVQGGTADSVFYIHAGRAKLTVVSKKGKEATVTLLTAGDFIGEESIAGDGLSRTATARTITGCVMMKIEKWEMLRVLHEEHSFSDFFLQFMVVRGIRTQADLIDQLFNSSERRLARILLLMADYGKTGEPVALIPYVTQETLAEMVGTTRSRVSFFMNRFRKLGYIEYKRRVRVHKVLLHVVLRDLLPEENSSRPVITDLVHWAADTAK
jgi:CRP/FNR family cyclic AMP-dependent transcriptional regulator